MNCETFNRLLDQLLDGELSDAQRRELEAHGAECPDCAAALRSAEQLKALFDEMEPEVDVPLAAQAKWRNAVREESKRRRGKRVYRWIGSAAAAVVVLVGVGLALNLRGAPKQDADIAMMAAQAPAAPEEDADFAEYEEAEEAAFEEEASAPAAKAYAASDAARVAPEAAYEAAEDSDAAMGAVVETDGATDGGVLLTNGAAEAPLAYESAEASAFDGAAASRAPTWELSLKVDDVDKACGRIRDLVEEYEGTADVQPIAEGGANVYVELPANNAGEFLSAVLPMDTSGQPHALPEFPDEGAVLVLLALH